MKPMNAQQRKEHPIYSGFIKYFPKAMMEVAHLSKVGNDQHNPGKPLHWDRSKSGDELDALARHLKDAGTRDTDGEWHDTKVAWRGMANLEKLLERQASEVHDFDAMHSVEGSGTVNAGAKPDPYYDHYDPHSAPAEAPDAPWATGGPFSPTEVSDALAPAPEPVEGPLVLGASVVGGEVRLKVSRPGMAPFWLVLPEGTEIDWEDYPNTRPDEDTIGVDRIEPIDPDEVPDEIPMVRRTSQDKQKWVPLSIYRFPSV